MKWHLIFRASSIVAYLIIFLPGETIQQLPLIAFLLISLLDWSNAFKLYALAAIAGIFIRYIAATLTGLRFTPLRLYFEVFVFILMCLPIGYCLYIFPATQFEGNTFWIQVFLFVILYWLGMFYSWQFMKKEKANPLPVDTTKRHMMTNDSGFYLVFNIFLLNVLTLPIIDFKYISVDFLLIRLGIMTFSFLLLWYTWEKMRMIEFDQNNFYIQPYLMGHEEVIPLENVKKIEITSTKINNLNFIYRFYYDNGHGEIKEKLINRSRTIGNLLEKFLEAKGIDTNELIKSRIFY